MLKTLALTLTLLVLPAPSLWAQITQPYTFSANTTILSSQVNANFNKFADALNRTGGTITGNIAVDANITVDGVDISDFLTATQTLALVVGSAAAPSFSVVGDLNTGMFFRAADEIGWSLGGTEKLALTASGLTVTNALSAASAAITGAITGASLDIAGAIQAGSGNVEIVDSTGKIPALSSTYFASLSAANLTAVPAAQLSGTITSATQDLITRTGTVTSGTWSGSFGAISGANLTTLNATNLASGTVASARMSGSYTGITGLGTIATASCGTGCLRTATGTSATAAAGTDISMNDYSFFPKLELDDCTGVNASTKGNWNVNIGAAAATDTVGSFSLGTVTQNDNCTAGSVDVHWRYITASDNPVIWVAVNDVTGEIVATWESEDPAGTGVTVPGATSRQLDMPTMADLAEMYVNQPEALAALNAYLLQRGWTQAPGVTVTAAVAGIPPRYDRAARLWALRFLAHSADLSPADLLLKTVDPANQTVKPKGNNFKQLLSAEREKRKNVQR